MRNLGALVALLVSTAAPVAAATLTVTTTGPNAGAVGVTGGLVCNPAGGGSCVYTIPSGTVVHLAANSPATPGVFSNPSGDAASCGPTSTCTFTLNVDSSIEATFTAGSFPSIQITLAGDGKGEVGADNNRCQNFELGNSVCTIYYATGSEVTLEKHFGDGNIFESFSAGTGSAAACLSSPCVFTLAGSSAVTAAFAKLSSLAVQPATATINVGTSRNYAVTGVFSNGASRSLFVGTGIWRNAAVLGSPRYSASAVALGGRTYVLGGTTAAGPMAAVEAYDPVTDTWAARMSMSTPRESAAAVQVGNSIYVIGGHTSGGGPVADVEAYDVTGNTWAPRASMPSGRAGLAAGVVDGIVYAVGGGESGSPLATLEAYDPVSNTWAMRAPMPTPRRLLAAAVVGGLLYAIGGDQAGTVEAYDPLADTWTVKASLPTPRSQAAAAVIDGLLYVAGGYGGAASAVVEVYNPTTNHWATLAPMPTARSAIAMAALDGRLFVAGGATGPEGNTSLVATHEAYRPPETTWWSSQPAVATITQTFTVNANGVGAGSATISARSGAISCEATSSCGLLTVAGLPGAPGVPSVSGAGNSITFAWSPPTSGAPVQSYTLLARLSPGGPVVASLPVGNVTTVNATAPNGTFAVTVQANNAVGTGPESPSVTITVPFVPLLPGAPQNLAASLNGSTATITWSAPASGGIPTGYVLLVSLSSGGSVFVALPAGSATSVVVPGVPPGVFYLRVAATNAAGRGPASNEVVVNAAGCTLPASPAGLAVGHAGGTATASWNAVPGSVSYTVLVQPGAGGPFSPVGTFAGLTVSAPVGPGLDVWVSVVAINTCGSSAMATPQRLTVP